MVSQNSIEEFVEAVKQEPVEKNNTHSAEVARVDKDGSVWVYVAGSQIETPVARTAAEVKKGDFVNVEWRNNKLYIAGNSSNPAVGASRVSQVEAAAQAAKQAANNAVADAGVARQAADSAKATAESVEGIAQHAEEVAEGVEQIARDAETSAGEAKTAADTAFTNLSQVQEVLEVVEWVAKHGTYTKATTFNPNATYYTVTATEVTEPSNADVDSHGVLIYYELDNGVYVRTEDETVDDQKTYYRVTGTPVAEPKQEYLSQYYTLAVTEAMADYIQSHLMLTNDGLYVMADGSEWKVLISDDGVYVLDPDGVPVNSMTGNGNIIGINDVGRSRTEIKSSGMQILQKIQGAGTAYDLQIADIGFGEAITGQGTLDSYPYYTFGARPDWANNYSSNTKYAVGDLCMYDGVLYVCTTAIDTPEAWNANHWQYSVGAYSMAQGERTVSAGGSSHAEGVGVAIRNLDHAEANGVAAGGSSHAEGTGIALGMHSHAQNRGTVAGYASQTAIGKYNDNQSDTAFEVGNGYDKRSRSNAFTVDWDGNVKAQGWAGFVQMFAGATAPSGWLFCDGSEVAVADYPLLYAVIGNAYGTPSDSDHFLLPDLGGRFPIGANTPYPLGDTGGSADAIVPYHRHSVPAVTDAITGGSHNHEIKFNNTTRGSGGTSTRMGPYSYTNTGYDGVYNKPNDHKHNLPAHNTATVGTDGEEVGANIPPYLGINFIICTGETS